MVVKNNVSVHLETLRKWVQVLLIPLALWAVSMQIFRAETRVEHDTMQDHASEQAEGLKALQKIVTENAKQIGILLDRENRRPRPTAAEG